MDTIDGEPQANGYVKQLIRTIDDAIRYVILKYNRTPFDFYRSILMWNMF